MNTNLLDVASRGLLDELVGRGEFVVDSYDNDVLVAHRVRAAGLSQVVVGEQPPGKQESWKVRVTVVPAGTREPAGGSCS